MIKTIAMSEYTEITSRENEKLKLARRVRDGKEDELIFVEGSRLCGEALLSNITIEFGLVSNEFSRSATFEDLFSLRKPGPALFSTSEKLLASVADTKSPQGIILIARRPGKVTVDEIIGSVNRERPVAINLHRINNPSNLGAVVRTAEAAGASGVILSENSTDAFSPKSLRASMGSAFRLPIVSGADFEEIRKAAKENDVRIVAVDSEGSVKHTDYDWKGKTLLVFGSEADGLPDEIKSAADESLKIEMGDEVESLNLAVSCGVILFEARRQHGT